MSNPEWEDHKREIKESWNEIKQANREIKEVFVKAPPFSQFLMLMSVYGFIALIRDIVTLLNRFILID